MKISDAPRQPNAPTLKLVSDVIPGDIIVDGAGRERAIIHIDSHGRRSGSNRLTSLVWDEGRKPIFRLPAAVIETRKATA